MTLTNEHRSIFVDEIISYFQPLEAKVVLDGTLGDGGHSLHFLQLGATVYGLDQDQQAIVRAKERLKSYSGFTAIHANFRDLTQVAKVHHLPPLDAILLDLGVSTNQLLDPGRGFSFKFSGPLDMRMDTDLGVTAADLVNALSQKELTTLFTNLGDEPKASIYAKRIVQARAAKPITTTDQLASLIGKPSFGQRTHPATRVFQALRMAVNLEKDALTEVLPQAVSLLKSGGILAIISFHSGEDRLVKHFFNTSDQLNVLTIKPVVPTENELNQNPRARSAKLRIAQKK